jgi:nicotinate-nucleotide--dimethylbenzimidazole phosphoribosyltransferase
MNKLDDVIESIAPVDKSIEPQIQAHLDDLTKPQGSLGRLEEFAMRYCLAAGTAKPAFGKKRIFCFAGDHGVADEGVSAFPKEVTPQMVMNMLGDGAAINVLARHAGAELVVIDIGVDDPLDGAQGLCRKKVVSGTNNIAVGPAMSVEDASRAVEVGIELAQTASDEGVTLVGTGEMGIANTTPSSALFASLLPCPVKEITGRGTGIDDDRLKNKIDVIKKALAVNKDNLSDPLSALAALGGAEIAGTCGMILGAASRRIPTVVDGFISSAGALVACRMCEHVKDYLFFSHLSQEQGHKTFMQKFGAEPILDLKLRLGEGTGAALAMSIIESAIKIYNEMATFSSAGVSEKDD